MAETSPHPLAAQGELFSFFALALGITAACQMPGVLAKWGLLPGGPEPYVPLVILGVFGPLLAALYLTRKRGRPGATKELFRTLYRQNPGVGWMGTALVLPGALLSLSLFLFNLAGGDLPLAYPADPPARLIAAALISVGEEVGWRGYALPRLCRALGKVIGTIVLGLLWTVWHIPMFLGSDVPLTLLPLMAVYFVAGSFAFTWMYFRTRGSLLIAVLLHLGAHLNNSHLALPETMPLVLHTSAWLVLATILLMLDRKMWWKVAPQSQNPVVNARL